MLGGVRARSRLFRVRSILMPDISATRTPLRRETDSREQRESCPELSLWSLTTRQYVHAAPSPASRCPDPTSVSLVSKYKEIWKCVKETNCARIDQDRRDIRLCKKYNAICEQVPNFIPFHYCLKFVNLVKCNITFFFNEKTSLKLSTNKIEMRCNCAMCNLDLLFPY